MVGRISGDEFVVLLESTSTVDGAELAAERICQALGEPVERVDAWRSELPGAPHETIDVTASIGIAFGYRDTVDELFRDADLALYAAKPAGRNRAVLFEPRLAIGPSAIYDGDGRRDEHPGVPVGAGG